MKFPEVEEPSSVFSFGIVVSTYHRAYTFGMLQAAEKVLEGHLLHIVEVPGAFEIPLQVQRLALTEEFHAILAFGVIWQGETLHNQEILRACTDAVMQISLQTNIPVMHEILSIRTEKEARARCLGKKLNRGIEAAQAALAVAGLPS